MLLLVAATEPEIARARSLLDSGGIDFLVTGIGPVEAALSLTRALAQMTVPYRGVVNVGVGGAFAGSGPGLLDLCLARREVLGDLGICLDGRIDDFSPSLAVPRSFPLENRLLADAEAVLAGAGVPFRTGTFVTVGCVSGTRLRGDMLRDRHQAICENMEGAALARVCQAFGVDFLEIRAISNLVEDRDPAAWRLREAAEAACRAAAGLLPALRGN
ncbi:MAG: futalosine hydrolase [Desulfobacteraceae bacterium]|nr:futalosine hydrolase [Desulfobacteraceae bacterium]